jgi:hypothetical protein
MLLVALASKWPADRTPDLQRVTVVSTREECETIGKKLVSEGAGSQARSAGDAA